mmetsp:Transcript_43254/g.77731  ORF Transcript_43254/g.77731 Transcript_43254/m.77731 type:complete len:174 (+) Transcript_43254:611-1132(+)
MRSRRLPQKSLALRLTMIVVGEVICGLYLLHLVGVELMLDLLVLMAGNGGHIMSFSVVEPPLELVFLAEVSGLRQRELADLVLCLSDSGAEFIHSKEGTIVGAGGRHGGGRGWGSSILHGCRISCITRRFGTRIIARSHPMGISAASSSDSAVGVNTTETNRLLVVARRGSSL